MMNKKGLNYIDWVISMGTFIVVVIAIFVFLKPGAQQEHTPDTLMDALTTRFFDNVTWEIKKIPLYIHDMDALYNLGSGTHDVTIEVVHDPFWDALHYEKSSPALSVTRLPQLYNIKCLTPPTCINEKITMYFTIHDYHTPLAYPKLYTSCDPDLSYCDMNLASSESLIGINPFKLQESRTIDYHTLKEQWNFPPTRDFAIYIDTIPLLSDFPIPGEQQSVHVTSRTSWMLSDIGNRTTTEVNFRVW